jgi:hypothetical protein
MSSVTQARPRVKPARHVGWLFQPDASEAKGSITIQVGRSETVYYLDPIPADFGRGFTLAKQDGTDTYAVNLHGGPYNTNLCDCLGHTKWGHCKHTEALLALEKAGRLPQGKAGVA